MSEMVTRYADRPKWKPILCLDFDGVLHGYSSGWKGVGKIPDAPVPGAIEFLLDAMREFEVHIYSSRSKNPLGRWAMKRWLRHHLIETWGGHLHIDQLSQGDLATEVGEWADTVLRKIRFPWFKPAAFLTLDDRAMTFDGTWPDLGDMKAFKPWNKRAKVPA